jgi:hypothetical protein
MPEARFPGILVLGISANREPSPSLLRTIKL